MDGVVIVDVSRRDKMLHPTGRGKERILLMGGYGAGKSNSWAELARYMRESKAPGKMFIIDTDFAAERYSDSYPDFYSNVEVADVEDYDESLGAVKRFRDEARIRRDENPDVNDWLVVDLADKPWDYAQEAFTIKAEGKNVADWLLSIKKGDETMQGDWGINWKIINKLYKEFIGPVIRFPGHVLACTPVDLVKTGDRNGKGGDSTEIQELFGRWGVKPKGQKDLGHQFLTVMLMQATSNGKWVMNTVKDVRREQVKGRGVQDFVSSYLIPIAGWRP